MTKRRYPENSPMSQPGATSGMETLHVPVVGNLAVQASIMEIFDEFTEVISGELKTMKLTDSEANSPSSKNKP